MTGTEEFPCDRCGACCRHVDLALATRFLDRGDGACKHYDDMSKLCMIYTSRPELCRVDVQFREHYRGSMTWLKFVKLNLLACEKLNCEVDLRQ